MGHGPRDKPEHARCEDVHRERAERDGRSTQSLHAPVDEVPKRTAHPRRRGQPAARSWAARTEEPPCRSERDGGCDRARGQRQRDVAERRESRSAREELLLLERER